jgi:hypothetical protein
MGSSYAQQIQFFFCRRCREYEEKTSPHYRAQKQRAYRRRKTKEAAQASLTERPAQRQG